MKPPALRELYRKPPKKKAERLKWIELREANQMCCTCEPCKAMRRRGIWD